MTRPVPIEDWIDLLAEGWHGVRRPAAFDGDTGVAATDEHAAGMRSATWDDVGVDRGRARGRTGRRRTR